MISNSISICSRQLGESLCSPPTKYKSFLFEKALGIKLKWLISRLKCIRTRWMKVRLMVEVLSHSSLAVTSNYAVLNRIDKMARAHSSVQTGKWVSSFVWFVCSNCQDKSAINGVYKKLWSDEYLNLDKLAGVA